MILKKTFDYRQLADDNGLVDQLDREHSSASFDVTEARTRLTSARSAAEFAEQYPSLSGGVAAQDRLRQDIAAAETELRAVSLREAQATDRLNEAKRNRLAAATNEETMISIWLLFIGGGFALAFIGGLIWRYVRDEKRRDFQNRTILSRTGSDQPADLPLDLQSLWRYNKDQLQRYHHLVLNYATSARRTTQLTLTTGFAFLLIIGIVAVLARTVPGAIASSVVVAAGAAVTGFVAQAVLRNSDTSSKEVSAFFSHPLDFERMLAAERIIQEMPEASQEAAQLLLVQALTGVTSDGQAVASTVTAQAQPVFGQLFPGVAVVVSPEQSNPRGPE
jgi:Flp pilus assembly protein TadB